MSGAPGLPAVLAVLADETRWRILVEIGAADLSASALAGELEAIGRQWDRRLAAIKRLAEQDGPAAP